MPTLWNNVPGPSWPPHSVSMQMNWKRVRACCANPPPTSGQRWRTSWKGNPDFLFRSWSRNVAVESPDMCASGRLSAGFQDSKRLPRRVLSAERYPSTIICVNRREQVVEGCLDETRGWVPTALTALVPSLMMRKNARLKATGSQTPYKRRDVRSVWPPVLQYPRRSADHARRLLSVWKVDMVDKWMWLVAETRLGRPPYPRNRSLAAAAGSRHEAQKSLQAQTSLVVWGELEAR
jgi:hypothetical protein